MSPARCLMSPATSCVRAVLWFACLHERGHHMKPQAVMAYPQSIGVWLNLPV
eukprot:SAG22_NODE_146_length_17566_cov_17.597847_15_plen_52_part_00